MPKVAHYATHNDTPFSTAFDNGHVADLHPDFTPPPSSPALSPSKSSPHLSNVSISIPGDLPYIYAPWINRSVHQLLSIDKQYTDIDRAYSTELFFPVKLAVYDLKSSHTAWRTQWNMHAHVNGVRVEGYPSSYFAANGGMTPRDKRNIVACIAKGFTLDQIWKSEFEPRGMKRASFAHNAEKIELIVVTKAAEDAAKWESYMNRDLRPTLPIPHPKNMGGIGKDFRQFSGRTQ